MNKYLLSFLFLCSLHSIFSMDVSGADEQEKTETSRFCIKTWIMVLDGLGRGDAVKALKDERMSSLSDKDREFVAGIGLIDEEGCLSPLVRDVVQSFKCAATN